MTRLGEEGRVRSLCDHRDRARRIGSATGTPPAGSTQVGGLRARTKTATILPFAVPPGPSRQNGARLPSEPSSTTGSRSVTALCSLRRRVLRALPDSLTNERVVDWLIVTFVVLLPLGLIVK